MALAHEQLTGQIINAAIKVHSVLGPGFLESVYETALCYELQKRGFRVERQVDVPVFYEDIEAGRHRLDVIVEGIVVLELKATDGISDAFLLTVKSYMAAIRRDTALILNFGQPTLEVKRVFPIHQRQATRFADASPDPSS